MSVSAKYKVVKIFRKSGRKKVLAKDLTLAEARKVVQSFPDSKESMVTFTKM